ncbi:hypothetical protein B0H10DRAFT_2093329 [Mycena sp. CBHHK59/15]|nr:hypothetical protein B0H10DRAFT_2093329 [Mycena sp. CBHHK59/15]
MKLQSKQYDWGLSRNKTSLIDMKSGWSPIGGPRQVLINGAGLASARALRPSLCLRPDFEK